MHPSSKENMKRARAIVEKKFGKYEAGQIILDFGGRDRNHKVNKVSGYTEIWKDVYKDYFVSDLQAGDNVTHVMSGPYELPFEDNSLDIILSGQTFEHVHNPFRAAHELTRVLKPGKFMYLIAPSAGPTHDNPDCWRFYRDSFTAIAQECGLKVIADWIDNGKEWEQRSARWKDHVFVGQKPA